MNDKIINIAQIGLGYWGPNLLRNLLTNKSCEVKTVVDLSKERRHFVRDLYPSVKVSYRVEDIINDAKVKSSEVVLVDDRLLTGVLASLNAKTKIIYITEPRENLFSVFFLQECFFATLRFLEKKILTK